VKIVIILGFMLWEYVYNARARHVCLLAENVSFLINKQQVGNKMQSSPRGWSWVTREELYG
jgi:hypothetical protein